MFLFSGQHTDEEKHSEKDIILLDVFIFFFFILILRFS